MPSAVPGSQNSQAGASAHADVLDQLRALYEAECPPGYEVQESVDAFYRSDEFWERFLQWIEQEPASYPASDKAFVESVLAVDGARLINIGTFYPWAEIEWGARAARWVGLDNNPYVLRRAGAVLQDYPAHHVSLMQADITEPLHLGERFDCVLDLSTLDQLDPRRYRTVLENYTRLSDQLVLAYDATRLTFAEYEFAECGFTARMNPDTITALLGRMGYRVVAHRPFACLDRRSYVLAVQHARREDDERS